jgi:hypothetical protein
MTTKIDQKTPPQQNKAKLIPEAKEILMLAEQRGYARSDVINAGIMALGRMTQPYLDRLISDTSKKAQEAAKLPEPESIPPAV